MNQPLLNLDDIIDRPVGLIRDRFRSLVIIPLAGGLPLALLSAVSQWLAGLNQTHSQPNPEDLANVGLVLLLVPVSLVIQMLMALATFGAIQDLLAGTPITLKGAYRRAFQARYFFTYMFSMLMIFCGFMCCIPGIAMAIGFGMLIPTMLAEDCSFRNGMLRSWNLTFYVPGGKLGQSAAIRVILVGVVYFAVTYSTTALLQLPLLLAHGFTEMKKVMAGQGSQEFGQAQIMISAASAVIQALINAAMTTYTACALTLLYRDARERYEGVELGRQLDERIAAVRPVEPPPAEAPAS